MDRTVATRILVASGAGVWLALYGLDVKKPYPREVVNSFAEPAMRFACYVALFLVANRDAYAALALAVVLLLLHFDYINLTIK